MNLKTIHKLGFTPKPFNIAPNVSTAPNVSDNYILISVMEGMQIEIRLDNCANVVYQFIPFPTTGG